MATAAPPSACQRLFRLKRRTSFHSKDSRDSKKCCYYQSVDCPPSDTTGSTPSLFSQNMMPTMATSFVFVLNENILETPCGKTSKPLNKQSLHLPSLDDDDDASSPDVATCIVDRHEIPKFKEDDEDDEGKENAKSLPCSRIVTPSLGSENDEEEDEDNPRSARINLASRFDAAMEDQN